MRCLSRIFSGHLGGRGPLHWPGYLLGLWLILLPALAHAEASTTPPDSSATLRYLGQDIITLRTELAGTSAQERVERAERRLAELEERRVQQAVTVLPMGMAGVAGHALTVGDILILTVVPGDLEATDTRDTASVANAVRQRLQAALDTRKPLVLVTGILWSMAALLLVMGAGALLVRTRRRISATLLDQAKRHIDGDTAWLAYLVQVVERIAQILAVFLVLALVYLWLTFALGQFPATHQLGETLGAFLIKLLGDIGIGMLTTLPNIITIAVIILIVRAITQSLHALFDAVQAGRLEVPGIYSETLGATRRLVMVGVWALGLTFTYPYIPGSNSDVFKGLSVLFGFMLTLGSAGIVSQLMSGITLIYSRALRKGDLVMVGDTLGTVQEVGALSTKLLNIYNEEITIPNAVLVTNQIRNLSRCDGAGVVAGTKLTIGYDPPWRQVHELLLQAAAKTPGLRTTPEARVLQRALLDFYVEYELLVTLDAPLDRLDTLSVLHANIQDAFNEAGIQIMSPNFVAQPAEPVLGGVPSVMASRG